MHVANRLKCKYNLQWSCIKAYVLSAFSINCIRGQMSFYDIENDIHLSAGTVE